MITKPPMPHGYRINNPFDIEHSPNIVWFGQIIQHDTKLLGFQTMAIGIRAGIVDARTKVYKDKLDTLETFIPKFAPPSENDTEQYIADMYQWLGMKQGQKIDLSTEANCIAWVHAICRQEMGIDWMPMDIDIENGVKLALGLDVGGVA